mgnify:CR=1 FL=1
MVYMANTFEKPKPIDRVNENLHSINLNLNQMKIEMQYIKSDILLIKQHFKNKEKEKIEKQIKEEEEKDQISKGWFF